MAKNPCEHCWPTCGKCGCWGLFCGCYVHDHECECHHAEWIDRRLECDKCSPPLVKEALLLNSDRWRYGSLLYNGLKSKLKKFSGTPTEKIAYIEKLAKAYTRKFNAACMTDQERVVLAKLKEKACYKGSGGPLRGSLQRTMWLTITEGTRVGKKFQTWEEFLKYTRKFKQNGYPKKIVPFER